MINDGVVLQGYCKGGHLPTTLAVLSEALWFRRSGGISRDSLRKVLSVPRWLIHHGHGHKADDHLLACSILWGLKHHHGFSKARFQRALACFGDSQEALTTIERLDYGGEFSLEYPVDSYGYSREMELSSWGKYLLGFASGLGSDDLVKAIFFMIDKHEGELRKTGKPYSEHPIRVCVNLINNGERDVPTLIAALLHDILENTNTTLEEIKREFKEEVAHITDLLTKKDGESLEEHFKKMEDDPRAVKIKAADKTDNLPDIFHVFSLNKQEVQIAETEEFILPMMKRMRRMNLDASDILVSLRNRIVDILGVLKEVVRLSRENAELSQKLSRVTRSRDEAIAENLDLRRGILRDMTFRQRILWLFKGKLPDDR